MNPQADTDAVRSALLDAVRRALTVQSEFEALAQKAQQLFRRSKAQFASRIDLLNGACELALHRFGLRC
jgi:hypothetical protein